MKCPECKSNLENITKEQDTNSIWECKCGEIFTGLYLHAINPPKIND